MATMTTGTCDKCQTVTEVTRIQIETCRATWGSPAEFDEFDWCDPCLETAQARDRMESDPDYIAEQRAIARGEEF